MKRYLRLVLYPLVLLLLFLRYAPLHMVRPVAALLPDSVIDNTRPAAHAAVTISSFPADTIKMIMPQPKWLADPARQRQLVSKFKYEPLQAEKDIVRLHDLYFLRAGKDFLVTYHRRNHEMLILSPNLRVVKIWPAQLRNGVKFDAPIDLEVGDEQVYAIDRRGTVASWNLSGVEIDHFAAPEPVRDFAVLADGDFLMHSTGALPFLLARVSDNGVLQSRLAPHIFTDSAQAKFLLQGILAIDRSSNLICFAYKTPYKLFFYNTAGKALKALDIIPNFQVAEPIIEREKGEITKVAYQKVVFDILWHDGLLWALISSEMGKAPQWLEIFSPGGEFLQRFALMDGISRFAFLQDKVYVLGYAPNYRIEAYDIVPVAGK